MKHAKIMLRIIMLFSIVILMSFIPENFRYFFGDKLQQNGVDWQWGFRHYIWMFMGVALFMYNGALIVSAIESKDEEQ